MSRWVRVSCNIFDHETFAKSEFSEREAWLWLIINSAWKDTSHRVGMSMVHVPRGSLFVTLRGLRDAWKWQSDHRVRGFLELLENGRMISREQGAGKTHITICNYSKFQLEAQETGATGAQEGRNGDALKIPVYQYTKDISLRSCAVSDETHIGKPSLKSGFDEFWNAYPARDGANPKSPAEKKFTAACKSGSDPVDIIEGARRYADYEAKRGKVGTVYIAQAVTWLNQKRWLDTDGQAKEAPASTQVFLTPADPEWNEWVEYRRKIGAPKPAAVSTHNETRGQWFPSKQPPQTRA